MHQLTIADCFKARSLDRSTLALVNKITFCPRKGYCSATGETYWEFAGKLKHNLSSIKKRLRNHTYQFDLCLKRTKRTKGRVRDLYISGWGDRIVERWLNDCLNILLHGWFSPQSYAYRIADLGLDSCQYDVLKSLRKTGKKACIVKRDITKFFYTIPQEIMLEKLSKLIDPNDYLFTLLKQRVEFQYHTGDMKPIQSKIGIPFGSPLACSLANILLTDLDFRISDMPVNYFRYADDFLIIGDNPHSVLKAASMIDDTLIDLQLGNKETHRLNVAFTPTPEFTTINKFKYLGIEYTKDGITRLPVEKQRKLLNMFKRELSRNASAIRNCESLESKISFAVNTANGVITNRIRSVAIIDYYLKHIDDEVQLKQLDLLVAKQVISAILQKPFRYADFSVISYKKLRKQGLFSLRHRHRLHHHGHLHTDFLQLQHDIINDRYEERQQARHRRVNQMRMYRKLKKLSKTSS